ncbi:hypothetical protein AX15_005029 [Amanita polypyramis BW_CC]|nr:hypothetical protein AX15_005029 [Amanita polypyramis BW_CC]
MLDLIRAVRLASENATEAPTLIEIAGATESYVAECSASPDSDKLISSLEQELQVVHRDVVDYSSLSQLEVFLVVLSHLRPFLAPTSLIYWWEIVLRPALREPKLGTSAVDHAKELVITILRRTEEDFFQKIGDFRRQLFDLYLLDARDEGSGDEVLEHAELDVDQRDRRACWKSNLEDILIRFGNENPQDFMTEVYDLFAVPSLRLQLFMLLNIYSSSMSFATSAAVLAKHPLITRLLISIFLDNSATVCSAASTVVVKVLPMLAANAHEELRALLPMLMGTLARLMCWKERHPMNAEVPSDEAPDADLERELEAEANPILQPDPQWNWERLETAFDVATSIPPSPRPYFTILYYLYPANMLKFLHGPIKYLRDSHLPSPWVESWEQAVDQTEIRARSERLLQEHTCHPALIWQSAASELEEPEFWTRFSVARIATEAIMLDIRNHALGIIEHQSEAELRPKLSSSSHVSIADEPTRSIVPLYASSGKGSISLQEMVNASVALKSSLNLGKSVPQLRQSLFTPGLIPSSRDTVRSPPPVETKDQDVPPYALQVMTKLQREVLLLRNELNFELWLSRENIKHIGRLYQDRNVVVSAEAERQGLYNKLRRYRAQVVRLESELREHKVQASSTKNKYADWNIELQKKLKELREEKKSWSREAASLRRTQKDNKSILEGQEKLLEEANRKIFELETWKKETQHKIDRLHDYERRLDQHIKMQRLWNEDFARFNERGEQISFMQGHFKQMELRVESYEKTQGDMDAQIRAYRRQIQTLEARLSQIRRRTDSLRHPLEQEVTSVAAERAALTKANQRLRDENQKFSSEIEELRAVIEVHLEGTAGVE